MVLVTVFSDPMVDVLTAITNLDNKNYIQESSGKRGQAIPIPGTCTIEFFRMETYSRTTINFVNELSTIIVVYIQGVMYISLLLLRYINFMVQLILRDKMVHL